MQTNKPLTMKLLLAVAATFAIATTSQAVFIPNLMPGSYTGTPTGGLGEFHFASLQNDPFLDGINTDAVFDTRVAPIIARPVDGTWNVQNIDYPLGTAADVTQGSTVQTFLGTADDDSYVGLSAAQGMLSTAFRISGFFIVDSSMDMDPMTAGIQVNWATYSDDGIRLAFNDTFIPGVDTNLLAPSRGFPGPGAGDVFVTDFDGEGLYSFEFIGWQGFGGMGYLAGSSIDGPNGALWSHLNGDGSNPHEDLGIFEVFGSQLGMLGDFELVGGGGGGDLVPEPASVSLLALGALALIRRRRAIA